MAKYDFKCNKCNIIWEYECSMKRAKKQIKCHKCKKLCERVYYPVVTHVVGTQHKTRGGDVIRFYNEAIKDSKERLALKHCPYKQYELTEAGAKAYGGEPVSEKRQYEKAQLTEKLTKQAREMQEQNRRKKT